jgi:hypothetical protein
LKAPEFSHNLKENKMDLMNMLGGMLSQYSGGAANAVPGQVEQHFGQAAQTMPSSAIADALGAALGSGQGGGFAQLAGQLFGNSGGGAQASMLNTLLATAGPALLSQVMGSGNTPGLASMLGAGGQPRELSPEEASQIPAEEVQHLAHQVHQQDPSIIDRVSEIYAEHPGVVKSLGGAVLSIAMAKLASRSTSA